MNKIHAAGSIVLILTALALASRRLAAYRALLPRLTDRINTRVTRINQHTATSGEERT
ncbi:hypothetical protein [Actinomadura sp. KC216]|uniref:hypothetical protein n=1 Tax=Actinomadura sp. KC216 TaxID=2530370 RepID=UPI0014043889|nr:hypothetical protein [Actinomadura sp. KC216]